MDDEFDMSEPLRRQARMVALKFYEFWTPVNFLVEVWSSPEIAYGCMAFFGHSLRAKEVA